MYAKVLCKNFGVMPTELLLKLIFGWVVGIIWSYIGVTPIIGMQAKTIPGWQSSCIY